MLGFEGVSEQESHVHKLVFTCAESVIPRDYLLKETSETCFLDHGKRKNRNIHLILILYEMFFIKELKPSLNTQNDYILRATTYICLLIGIMFTFVLELYSADS